MIVKNPLLAMFAICAIAFSQNPPPTGVNRSVDCYLAVYDLSYPKYCQGLGSVGCDFAEPIPTQSGSIGVGIRGQPGQTMTVVAQINSYPASASQIVDCWWLDIDPFGSYYSFTYTFPSNCTTGANGSCWAQFTLYSYVPGDNWDFVVQGVMGNATVLCPGQSVASSYCSTMSVHCHAP